MGFSRQEAWSGLPFPSPGDVRDPGKIHISCVTWEALGHLIKKFVFLRKYIIICCIHYYYNFNWIVGFFYYLKYLGTSLVLSGKDFAFQCRSLQIKSLIEELRSCIPGNQKNQNIKQKQYCNKFNKDFSSVQSLGYVGLFATPWITARQASLSFTNSRSLLKLMPIESVMPSSHLILCCPLLLLPPTPPSIRVFSNESTLCMRWPKYWSFSFSISPSNEHPGLISLRMDWLDLLAVQGTLKSLLQHHSSKASIFWCSAFFTSKDLKTFKKYIKKTF